MSEPHATNGAGAPQSHETVSAVSHSSAPWIAEGISKATYYRRRQANKPETQELNKQIDPEIKLEVEPEIEDEIAEPEIKLDKELSFEPVIANNKPAEPITAKPKADAAAERIKMLLDQINGRDPRQLKLEAYAKEVGAVYKFWEQSGLAPEHLQLFQAHPDYMLQLSRAAHNQAVQQHPMNSADYFELGRKLVFEHLDNLRQQTKEAAAPQPETNSMPPNEQPPAFLAPTPTPVRKPQPSGRSGLVSAPVSRQTPDGRIAETVNDPRSVRLSPEQVEAAKVAGVDLRTYAENLIKMQRMRASGEII